MSAAAAADAAPIEDRGAAAAAAAPPLAEATLPPGEDALYDFMFSLVMPTRRMQEAAAPIGAAQGPPSFLDAAQVSTVRPCLAPAVEGCHQLRLEKELSGIEQSA